MRTFQVPNEWQELDEEELSDGGQELLSSCGPLSVILYARVKKQKLFTIHESSLFLEKLVSFYIKNVSKMENSIVAMKNMKSLASLFPSIKELDELLKTRRIRSRDMVFFKLILDILTLYYKQIEVPLFKKLQSEIIPLALFFYESHSTQSLNDLATDLISCVDNKSIS